MPTIIEYQWKASSEFAKFDVNKVRHDVATITNLMGHAPSSREVLEYARSHHSSYVWRILNDPRIREAALEHIAGRLLADVVEVTIEIKKSGARETKDSVRHYVSVGRKDNDENATRGFQTISTVRQPGHTADEAYLFYLKQAFGTLKTFKHRHDAQQILELMEEQISRLTTRLA